MALIDLNGGDEAYVRARAAELIDERGGKADYAQTEDLIIELLQHMDLDAAYADRRDLFWHPQGGWAAWARGQYGDTVYKDPDLQAYVATLFEGSADIAAAQLREPKGYEGWKPALDALAKGAKVTTEGDSTHAGHVVAVVGGDATGLIINDPWGMYIDKATGYLVNDQAPQRAHLDMFERRARHNPKLLEKAEALEAYGAWGEQNFWTYEEAEAANLGKWVKIFGGS